MSKNHDTILALQKHVLKPDVETLRAYLATRKVKKGDRPSLFSITSYDFDAFMFYLALCLELFAGYLILNNDAILSDWSKYLFVFTILMVAFVLDSLLGLFSNINESHLNFLKGKLFYIKNNIPLDVPGETNTEALINEIERKRKVWKFICAIILFGIFYFKYIQVKQNIFGSDLYVILALYIINIIIHLYFSSYYLAGWKFFHKLKRDHNKMLGEKGEIDASYIYRTKPAIFGKDAFKSKNFYFKENTDEKESNLDNNILIEKDNNSYILRTRGIIIDEQISKIIEKDDYRSSPDFQKQIEKECISSQLSEIAKGVKIGINLLIFKTYKWEE